MTKQPVNLPDKPSHLKDLILLFAVPIGIAIFAAVAVYAPQLFAKPKYDFIYSVCSSYDCPNDFNVDGSGYVSQSTANRDSYNGTSTLRYYVAKDDSTKSLTLAEAKRYQLYTYSKSPDGYSLTRDDISSGFLFWGNSDSGWYLKNGAKKKKVELSSGGLYYSQDIKLLGWVNK